MLQRAVAFEVQNVHDYAMPRIAEEGLPLLPNTVPNVAPLADVAWFEWTAYMTVPDGTHPACYHTAPDGTRYSSMRCALRMDVLRDAQADGGHVWPIDHITRAHPALRAATHDWLTAEWAQPARWVVALTYALQNGTSGEGVFTHGGDLLYVAPDGHIVRCRSYPDKETMTAQEIQDWREQWSDNFLFRLIRRVGCMSVCFAHCKGVSTVEHRPSRQRRRVAARHGRLPPVVYKTLDIPGLVTPRAQVRMLHDEEPGSRRRLHFVRGHYATYGPAAPLFGSYVGTVFVAPHLRGTEAAGVTLKDYRVHARPQDVDV